MPRRERPLEAGDDRVVDFAAALRELRKEAGSPTYRALSTKAGYSAAALSEAASGRKLPGLALASAYVRACGGDVDSWEARWRAAAAELASEAPEPPAEAPYLGLAAFEAGDADRFFGRAKLVAELVDVLGEHRFAGVFGASGSGKSSLLRAGLAGSLGDRRRVLVTPGEHPLRQCADGLAERGHLLIVDQFEEVFTLCADEDERAQFVAALVTLAQDEHGSAVLIGVRADFYGQCGRYPGLVAALRNAQVLVGAMTGDELRAAIVEPAAQAGCRVEATLVGRLIADTTGQPAMLPLVSHALLETWRRRQGVTLTLAGYEAAGGIRDAIAHSAELVYAELEPERQLLARRIFLRLTALGDGTEDTKRRASLRELDDGPAAAAVLGQLAEARLLTLDRDGVDIAHEALIRCWPRLHDWLAEDRDGLRVHRQLTEATDAWESHERDPGALYRGARLAVTREWAAADPALVTTREREFLDASAAAETAEQTADRRRARRLRRLAVLLGVLLLVAAGTTVFAVRANDTLSGERNQALARQVAAQVESLRSADPALAAQLSLAAHRLADTQETRDGLLSVPGTPPATLLTGPEGQVVSVAYRPDGRVLAEAARQDQVWLWDTSTPGQPVLLAKLHPGHGEPVAVAFSPDGRTLAIGTTVHSVRLWNVSDPRHPVPVFEKLLPGAGTFEISAVKFSHGLLGIGAWDGTVVLWDVRDPSAPRQVGALAGHTGGVSDLAFSPDGTRVATTSMDHTVRLWDVTDPARPRPDGMVTEPGVRFRAVDFAPDGTRLATVGLEQGLQLWDVAGHGRLDPLATATGHQPPFYAVAFAPDGRSVAAGGAERTALVWDITDPRAPREVLTLAGHLSDVHALAFSPDGATLASGSLDRTVRLEAVDGIGRELHPADVTSLVLRGDGKVAVTTADDFVIRLWDIADPARRPRLLGTLPGHTARIWTAKFSPDGRTLYSVSDDDTTRVWDVTDPARPAALTAVKGSGLATMSAAVSPDGRTLATSDGTYSVRLRDVTNRAAPVPLGTGVGHSMPVVGMAFAPDGRTLASVSTDGTVRLWDVTDRAAPRQLWMQSGQAALNAVAFSPDGRILATGGADGALRLWDVSNPSAVRDLGVRTGHLSEVFSVAFSPDGRFVVTGSNDKTIRVWGVTGGVTVLSGHTNAVAAVAFRPGTSEFLSTGLDRSIRSWDVDPDAVAARICTVSWPRITAEEWARYFPGLPFTPPC